MVGEIIAATTAATTAAGAGEAGAAAGGWGILATLGKQAGIQGIGYLLSRLFGKEPEIPDIKWGAERAEYMSRLEKEMGIQRKKTLPVLRRESVRAGTPMGGAYLESVTEMENKMNEILGREMSQFELNQVQAERSWAQKGALSHYAWETQKQEELKGAIGTMAGTMAAYPRLEYGEAKEKIEYERQRDLIERMAQVKMGGPLIAEAVSAIIKEMVKLGFGDTKAWESFSEALEKYIGGG